MKVGVLYSGGKDSNLALYKASKFFDIAVLINLVPKSEESMLFHFPNSQLTQLQSKSLEIPLIQEYCENDEKEQLKRLKEVLIKAKKEFKIEGLVTGAIRSTYQASRFQKVCKDLNLWCFNPLWLRNEREIIEEALKLNFKIIITRFSAYPFKKEFVGKIIDREFINFLERNRINIAGEGGEYETFVLDMPLFKKEIKILDFEKKFGKWEGDLIIKKAVLVEK